MTKLHLVPKALRIAPSFVATWGWWNLLLDLLHLKKAPYRFGRRLMRPNTTDAGIYTEVFAGQAYGPALPFIRTARCILDVGANVGIFTDWARKNNTTAQIHLFEPLTGNSDRCVLDSRMVLHKVAVSDYNGELPVSTEPALNYGSGHLAAGHFSSPDPHPPIKVIDARDLFNLCGTKVLDVLKLDCEGAELTILRRLELASVRCVIFEYHKTEEIPLLKEVLLKNRFEIKVEDEYHRVMYAVNTVQPPG
jgi:FkbM family methyltransferase